MIFISSFWFHALLYFLCGCCDRYVTYENVAPVCIINASYLKSKKKIGKRKLTKPDNIFLSWRLVNVSGEAWNCERNGILLKWPEPQMFFNITSDVFPTDALRNLAWL